MRGECYIAWCPSVLTKIWVERLHFLFMFRCCLGSLLWGQFGWCERNRNRKWGLSTYIRIYTLGINLVSKIDALLSWSQIFFREKRGSSEGFLHLSTFPLMHFSATFRDMSGLWSSRRLGSFICHIWLVLFVKSWRLGLKPVSLVHRFSCQLGDTDIVCIEHLPNFQQQPRNPTGLH